MLEVLAARDWQRAVVGDDSERCGAVIAAACAKMGKTWEELGLEGGSYSVRDIWAKNQFGGTSSSLPPPSASSPHSHLILTSSCHSFGRRARRRVQRDGAAACGDDSTPLNCVRISSCIIGIHQ